MSDRLLNRYGFRACLDRRGMTQKQLAKELGVPYGTVNRMARGGWEPPDELFQRVLAAMGETDPKRLTEDWPLAEAAATPGIDHASRHDDMILLVRYDRSPENVHHWREALKILARAARRKAQEGEDPGPDEGEPPGHLPSGGGRRRTTMSSRSKWWAERADARTWDMPDLSRLWSALTERGRGFLAAVATRPGGYSGAELDADLALDKARGGIEGGITKAVQKLFPERDFLPYGWEQEPYRYTMHPATAEHITTLAGRR